MRGQWKTRFLPTESKVLASEVRDAYHSDRKRAELALQLDLVLEKFCARRSGVEAKSGILSIGAYRILESHYVEHAPPVEDLAKLVEALKSDTPCGEAEFFFKHGGMGLWRAWQCLTGQGRSYCSVVQNAESSLDQMGECVTWEPECDRSGAIEPLPNAVSSVGTVEPIQRESIGMFRPKWRQPLRAFKVAMLLTVSSVALSAAGYFYIDPGLRAYRAYKIHGPAKALEILKEHLKGPVKGDYSWYTLAHSYYLKGNFDEASVVARKLTLETKSKTLIGDCYYLLGLINSRRGRIEQAIGYFKEADLLYIDSPVRLFNCQVARASALESSQTLELLSKISESIKDSKEALDWPYFWRVRIKALRALGRHTEAIEPGLQAMKQLELDDNSYAQIQSSLGYSFACLGDFSNAYAATDEAKAIFTARNDSFSIQSNNLNYILLRKCQGLPFREIEKELIQFASSIGDEVLVEELLRTMRERCDANNNN